MTGLEPLLLAAGASASTAATVGTIGSIAGAVGTGLSALGTLKQANASSAASEYNAKIAEQNAAITEQQGKVQEDATKREQRLRYGANVAAASASGVGMSSFDDVFRDNAQQDELDLMTIRQNTQLRRSGFLQSSALDKMSAKSSRQAGYIGAGAKLLTRAGLG